MPGFANPVASTVDRFIETFSRYLELVANEPDFRVGGAPIFSFPHDAPELIARDRSLVELIKEGRFDRLMYEIFRIASEIFVLLLVAEPAHAARRAVAGERTSPKFGAGSTTVGDRPGASMDAVSSEDGWKFTYAPSTADGPANSFSTTIDEY